jgi:predicted phage terminase large subunit-like protein
MVFMPPRHGKSELVSRRLPAYLMGRNPKAQIIAASYSSDLASMMNRDVQRIMDTPEYRQIFPEASLNESNIRTTAQRQFLRNSDVFEIVGHGGVYRSAGVGGGITGMGANYAIIDDPVKNQQDADSPTMRDNVWNWYASTLYTRLQDPRSILLTLTRWHEDDLAGRLLAKAKEDPNADQWVVLKLPARAEHVDRHERDLRKEGEALWETDFGDKVLTSIQASVGSRVWNALYQQRPSALAGNIIQKDWIKRYDHLPKDLDETILVADLSFKEGPETDFTAIECWGRKGADIYLIDQIRNRMDFPAQIDALRALSARHPTAFEKQIEEAANGAAIISLLRHEIVGLLPVKPMTSKLARLASVSPIYEAGNVHYPTTRLCPWVETNISEILDFPNGMHDDTVDCASMALMRLGQASNSIARLEALSKW